MPGVVAQEVDGPEPLEGGVPQMLHRVRSRPRRSCTPMTSRPSAWSLPTASASAPWLDVGQDHLHALAGEPLAHGLPDAAGPAGDHGHLAGEVARSLAAHR